MNCYCQERKGRRYFRMRVPRELHPYLSSEISYPIGDLDLKTAHFRCKLLGDRLRSIFEQARHGVISMGILHPFVREICANILYHDAQFMTSLSTPAAEYNAAIIHYRRCLKYKNADAVPEFIQLAANQGVTLDPEDPAALPLIMNYCQGMIETCRILKERANGNMHNGFDAPDASGNWSTELSQDDITAESGIPPTLKTEDIQGNEQYDLSSVTALPESMERASQEPETTLSRTLLLAQQLAALAQGKSAVRRKPSPVPQQYAPVVPDPQPVAEPPLPYGVRKAKMLKDGIEEYLHEKTSGGKMDAKTAITMRSMLSLVGEVFGPERFLHEIERNMIVKLRSEILPRYPLNRRKHYPGKSLQELLKMVPAPTPISERTQRHYMEYWSMLFNWCVQCGYMANNPVTGLIDKPEATDLTELRPPFERKELEQIFADIARMPELPRFRKELYPMRYWIPLIGLYQGMRLNEICQLHIDDICVVDGVPCIRIRPCEARGQKVKNSSSIRTVPIHSALLRLDFLDYVISRLENKCRKNDQLFEELTGTTSGYQRKMQQFNKRIHDVLKISARKSFHSFRHNFDTELSNKEPNAFLIQCLDGHARQGELGKRYSKGDLLAMKETLEKVEYGLDIFKIMGCKPLKAAAVQEQIKHLTELTAPSDS